MSSRLITEYLGADVIANRPAAPDLPAGVLGIYYATDTLTLSVWDGTTWTNIGGTSRPAIVQQAAACPALVSSGITLASPPTQYNLLVAAVVLGTSANPPVSTGDWFRFASDTTPPDYAFFSKIVTSGSEPALQQPTSTNDTGGIAIWEIELGMSSTMNGNTIDLDGSFTSGNITPASLYGAFPGAALLLGITGRRGNSDLPTSITGANAGPTANDVGNSVSIAMFDLDINALDTPTIGITYAVSASTRRSFTIVR